jgi:N,N'-diacetyllegionaminate synthase
MSDVNLRAMLTIGDVFDTPIGYSDHTLGHEVTIAAVALGAVVVEKHLTLDKSSAGPDHSASLDPDEFTKMVTAIRNIETALGDGIKATQPSEVSNRVVARRSIVASVDIAEGEAFTPRNISAKRPGSGISPMHWDEVIGRNAKRDFEKDELIEL